MHNKFRDGFTLLELLIVIAIIGILVSISLSYLGASKNKGGDAGVKSNLTNARSQAALFYANLNPQNYTNVCIDTNVRRMIQTAARAAAITPKATAYLITDQGNWNTEACHSDATRYVIWVPLRNSSSGTSIGWCADNTDGGSRSVQVTGSIGLANGALVCPP